jgi:hypothetical protein
LLSKCTDGPIDEPSAIDLTDICRGVLATLVP